jgi:hypothetical protein
MPGVDREKSSGFFAAKDLSVSPNGAYLTFTYVLNGVPDGWRNNKIARRLEALGGGPEVIVLYDVKASHLQLATDSPMADPLDHWSDDSRGFAIYAASPVNSTWSRDDETAGDHSSDPWNRHVFAVKVPDLSVSEIESEVPSGREASIVSWAKADEDMVASLGDASLSRLTLTGQRWREVEKFGPALLLSQDSTTTNDGNLFVGVRQTPKLPPDLFAYSNRTKTTTILTDLNPELGAYTFGDVEETDWLNSYGSRTIGRLLKPTNYVQGKIYPLVVMTHNAIGRQFVCDSPNGTAFPPQTLATSGFLVLEVDVIDSTPEIKGTSSVLAEVENWVASVESGIDLLAQRGMINRDEVGIIGFSRTAWYVDFMLTHSHLRFMAASSADDGAENYGSYWLWQDRAGAELETLYEGTPYGSAFKSWLEYAPAFNADKVSAPLLMEYIGQGVWAEPYTGYEFFTALQRQGKAVDLFFYPNGDHELDTPFERVASLQRNVDWFRFWMQGYEGKAPGYDPEQFTRWRKLRDQQQWNDRMRSRGKDPTTEFLRQTNLGSVLGDEEAAPAAHTFKP